MRMLSLSTLLVLPAALVAQAPADIPQLFQAERPAIEKLLKEFKAKEALAKAETVINGTKPAYDKKDLPSLAKSYNQYREIVNAHLFAATTAFSAGEWEKESSIREKAVAVAKENQESLKAGAQPILDVWAGAETKAKEFLAAAPATIQTLKADIEKTNAEDANVEAKKKLSQAELKALQDRVEKAKLEAKDLNQLETDKRTHETNIQNFAQVRGYIDGVNSDLEIAVKKVSESLAKSKDRIKSQADEIEAFNAKLKEGKKKVQIKGNSNWVDAVMNDHENITKLGTPEIQASFLNRLLVLDPGNAKAQKALDNIVVGKAPFEAEKKPVKGKGKKSH